MVWLSLVLSLHGNACLIHATVQWASSVLFTMMVCKRIPSRSKQLKSVKQLTAAHMFQKSRVPVAVITISLTFLLRDPRKLHRTNDNFPTNKRTCGDYFWEGIYD